MPLAARPEAADPSESGGLSHRPPARAILQDIYFGPGPGGRPPRLDQEAPRDRPGIPGGRRRLELQPGPAGEALVCTPVSIGNGSWDAKIVLGEATVHPDGSAFFTLPARTPIYFQAIDEQGRAIQTMRSWPTLQPGESISCVGCHESKNDCAAVTAGRAEHGDEGRPAGA